MTDESASETEEVIHQHELTWRSEGMVHIQKIGLHMYKKSKYTLIIQALEYRCTPAFLKDRK